MNPVCPRCGEKVTPAQRQSEDGLWHGYCKEQHDVEAGILERDENGQIVSLIGRVKKPES